MKRIDVFENGLFLQFVIDAEDTVHLVNFSCKEKQIPDDFSDDSCAYSPCEVHITGAEFYNSRHIKHRCPTIPKYHSHSDKKMNQVDFSPLFCELKNWKLNSFISFTTALKPYPPGARWKT